MWWIPGDGYVSRGGGEGSKEGLCFERGVSFEGGGGSIHNQTRQNDTVNRGLLPLRSALVFSLKKKKRENS